MDWKDRLRPASYRGVRFNIRDTSSSGGRRAAPHVFPFRDTPLVEDLGRVPRAYSIDGYVIGDDYLDQLERLVRALESPGIDFPFRPGAILVHPTLGRVQAICRGYTIRETLAEGRMARLTMDFIETGEELAPLQTRNAVGLVDERAAAVRQQLAERVAADASSAAVPEVVRQSLSGKVRELGELLSGLDVFSGPTADVAALQDSISTLLVRASELATAPTDLAAAVDVAIDRVRAAAGTAEAGFEGYRSLFVFAPTLTGGTSTVAQLQDANSQLVADQVVAAAIAGASSSAVRREYATLDDATETRRLILDAIDGELEDAPTDDYTTLVAMRAELVLSIPPPNEDLPRLETIELRQTTAALVLAWDLYDDATRDGELVARNGVPHPGRMPALQPLQVLTRG